MDSTLNSQQLVRLLAEESRRKVVAALVLSDGPQAATELASVTDLDLRQVVDAADRLVSGGLVQQSSGIYELDDAASNTPRAARHRRLLRPRMATSLPMWPEYST